MEIGKAFRIGLVAIAWCGVLSITGWLVFRIGSEWQEIVEMGTATMVAFPLLMIVLGVSFGTVCLFRKARGIPKLT